MTDGGREFLHLVSTSQPTRGLDTCSGGTCRSADSEVSTFTGWLFSRRGPDGLPRGSATSARRISGRGEPTRGRAGHRGPPHRNLRESVAAPETLNREDGRPRPEDVGSAPPARPWFLVCLGSVEQVRQFRSAAANRSRGHGGAHRWPAGSPRKGSVWPPPPSGGSALTFLHWRYDPDEIRRLLPRGLDVDTWDGSAWVGVTPFVMVDIRIGRLPAVPGVSTFPETNLRTYVRGADGRDGLWFFSLEAGSLPMVLAASALYGVPYRWADMTVEQGETVRYRSRRRGAPRCGPRHRDPPRVPVRLRRRIRRRAPRPLADGPVAGLLRSSPDGWRRHLWTTNRGLSGRPRWSARAVAPRRRGAVGARRPTPRALHAWGRRDHGAPPVGAAEVAPTYSPDGCFRLPARG